MGKTGHDRVGVLHAYFEESVTGLAVGNFVALVQRVAQAGSQLHRPRIAEAPGQDHGGRVEIADGMIVSAAQLVWLAKQRERGDGTLLLGARSPSVKLARTAYAI